MYLKSIEIQGFKSFAHKMVFEFHDGITAIVGPNGSGKSNVGDAVRWVLGEQSAKQLRGNKMEDIIFAGTETRKPLGFAYVAITLDNADHKLPIEYDEVKVARRVFRSGESEYLINGSSCRLKDVQELFLDTGIGKEGYSIIGQGQIEKILSGKPEERRELFDEAAGIVKFKKRKAAAQKDLEIEKQNLCRINDILSEIEKQVAPLEAQSLVAKKYLKYRDELKTLDVTMFLLEYERIEEEQKELEKKANIVGQDLRTAQGSYESAKLEYEKLQERLDEINVTIDGERNKLSENKVKKEQLEGQIKVLQEQITATKLTDEHYRERLESIEVDIKDKEKQLDELQHKIAEFDKKVSELEESKQSIETNRNNRRNQIDASNKRMEELKSEIFELLSQNSTVRTNMQRYETILEQNNIKKVTLNQRILKNKSNEAIYTNKIQSQKLLLEEIREKVAGLDSDNQKLDEDKRVLHTQESNLNKNIDHARQDYHREKSRLEYLTNITERYEGYGNSIRKIMEQKSRQPGIHGVVADIIKVEKEYETAVETALGASIQNIVTDTETTAKSLIEFLKKNKFGRATFLPLSSVKNRSGFNQEAALKEPGVVGLASTLVKTESTYRQVIESLLGRVIVVTNIDDAIRLAKKYQYSLRIVTLEGEQLNPGGSMSGGAFKNSSNLLGRRREIDDIKQHTLDMEQSIEALIEDLKKIDASKQLLETNLANNKKLIQELYLRQNTEKINMNQAIVDLQNVKADYEEIHQENLDIERQGNELKEKLQLLRTECHGNENRTKENESIIATLEQELILDKSKLTQIEEEYSSIKLQFGSLEQTQSFNYENRQRVQEELIKLHQEEKKIHYSIDHSADIIREKETLIRSVQQSITECNTVVSKLEQTILELNVTKEEWNKQYKEFFTKREELNHHISVLDKESYRLNNQLEKMADQLDQLVNYMWEQYEITYGVARTMKTEEEVSLLYIRKQLQEVKQKIKELGSVNVNAIEDYKNLVERFELLQTQRDDLVKAEEVLLGIIEELDTEMRKQFEERFQLIRTEFDKVFKQLFGGGKGSLELVEGEDILEAGIRINAQPPGKKLQNMMQLSGGEKSLTAIALLFAIQNLKPSPFCLLDEIEAALDESNVDRYAQYLKKLTDHTQFIVITHRRGTMDQADRLYGITMQEKGISTMVSVNLIENELEK